MEVPLPLRRTPSSAVPHRQGVSGRRRRTPAHPHGRTRDEHRHSGRRQPRLETRPGPRRGPEAVLDTYHAERHGPALLIRPDGYITWAGPTIADPSWRNALREWTGDAA
ncbi:aromatic-ring hydroxylase C-terminal domain-containing protein [Mycobacterium sp.]|uniref:aromatic-ring hydroxylase C-terminal domain-containing protein n=1 Tax=Mycobacterium sp. TaxID=1785 RepID=UPI003F961937